MKSDEATPLASSHASHCQFWVVPFARNPLAGERAEELRAMSELLAAEPDGGGLVLSGAGGVGKSQLALEYACLHREAYRAVFWVLAGTRETLNAAYSDIAALLELPESGEADLRRIVEAVRRWLEANPGWLLILDDAGDSALLKDFLPTVVSGHVLLTTRGNGFGKLARRLRLKALTVEQSMSLLLRRSGLAREAQDVTALAPRDQEAAREIATRLNGQPLALNLAGAYLAATGCGLTGYLGRLNAGKGAISRSPVDAGIEGEQNNALATAVHLAGEKAARRNSAAAHVLSFCAFLAPAEIPLDLLVACCSILQKRDRKLALSPSRLNALLTTLQNYELLAWNHEAQTLMLAREVQTAWRNQLGEEEEKAWAEQAVRAIGSLYAALDMDDWDACQRLQPHAQVCAAHIARWHLELVEGAWLLHHMGWYLHTRGQYAEAQHYEERALALYRAVLGDEHSSTAMILNNLAVTYEDQGKLNEAITLHTQALAIRRSLLGENHAETAASSHNLALLYHDQGKLAEAASYYRQALSIRQHLLGDEHPDIATLLADLAALATAQGKFHEALAHYQQALAIRRKALGSRHPDTILLLGGLSEVYQAQGEYAEALRWRRHMLSAQRKTLSKDHPDLAASFAALATIHQAQGQLDEAAFWLHHALALLKNAPAPVQIESARLLEKLAIAYEDQEQSEKAEALYQQALGMYQQSPERGSQLDLARCSYNLALLYHDQHRTAEARPLLERAVNIWQEQRGPQHADTRKAREKYEQILQKQKQKREKHTQPVEEVTEKAERDKAGGLKSLARAMRGMGRKKSLPE